MRSEFEKKLKCKELLSELTFCEETKSYIGDILPTNLATINGAYWGWEKRQTEVDELKSTIEKQKKLSLKAIENAKACSSLELQLAQKLHAESSPDSLKSERAMNAQLTNENLLLESKVDELQKRVDKAIYLLPSIKAENDLWGCDQVERQIELLEQALKGGLNE